MSSKARGTLIIIGGHEDKTGEREILTELSKKAAGRNGHLLIVTVATNYPKEVADEYQEAFGEYRRPLGG